MCKSFVEPGRPQMTIWRIHIACWIPETRDKHRIYSTYYFSRVTMVARTRLNVLLYVHFQSCHVIISASSYRNTQRCTHALHSGVAKYDYHPGGQYWFLPYFAYFVIHSHLTMHSSFRIGMRMSVNILLGMLTLKMEAPLTYSMEQSPSWEANWFCS
jgi:hypothetical protein